MRRLLPLLCAAGLLVGCTTSAASDELTAVATVYPLAWVVEQVAPEADLTSLAVGGQDPHDQELSPQQRAHVAEADLVVYLGEVAFQPQVEAAVTDSQGAVVSVDEVAGDRLRRLDGGAVDPHAWFDAELLAEVAEAVGTAAAEADPANAEAYRTAAQKTASELASAAEDVAATLRSCRHRRVVVSHEAFGYLLEPHGLEQDGISSAAGHSEASPGRIAELAAQIREERLPAVLTEPVEGRTDAEVVAREAGVELIEIYSLDIVGEAQAAKGFPQLLREQAAAVAQAAECAP